MNIINLTPHTVTVYNGPEGATFTREIKFLPSGKVARVSVSRQCVSKPQDSDGNTVSFFVPSFGEVEGLPQYEENTFLIVSALVRTASPDRWDLISPGNLVRDENGSVIGCDGFDCNFNLI